VSRSPPSPSPLPPPPSPVSRSPRSPSKSPPKPIFIEYVTLEVTQRHNNIQISWEHINNVLCSKLMDAIDVISTSYASSSCYIAVTDKGFEYYKTTIFIEHKNDLKNLQKYLLSNIGFDEFVHRASIYCFSSINLYDSTNNRILSRTAYKRNSNCYIE
jgi:hypothetical protein